MTKATRWTMAALVLGGLGALVAIAAARSAGGSSRAKTTEEHMADIVREGDAAYLDFYRQHFDMFVANPIDYAVNYNIRNRRTAPAGGTPETLGGLTYGY